MPRLLLPLAALAVMTPLASAGVKFTSPAAGATLTAGTAIDVKWEDDGKDPKLSDMLTYELFVFAGGNEDGTNQVVATVTTAGSFAVGNAASGMVGVAVGEDSPKNAYFLKLVGVGKNGGQLITYSPRFSYSGMTGTFPAAIKQGAAGISGTAAPPTQNNVVKPGANPADKPAQPDDDAYNMEYTMQTGPTRYAPMQPVPPKTITAKNTKPLYQPSDVPIAKTRLPIPSIVTTLTQSQTFSVEARENTVAPAPHPNDDMAKFLNRWKD